jgi:galactokinase
LSPAAGLSSSSALVIAIFFALARINALEERVEYRREIHSLENLAGYLGTVENGQNFGSLKGTKGVGTFGGSQDHTAILCCLPGQLSQYSFCPVRFERAIDLPRGHVFAIGVTGVSAAKTGDALAKYNRASLISSEVLAMWRSVTGRDDPTLMAAATSSASAPDQMREALKKSLSSSFTAEELLNRFEQFRAECLDIIPGVAEALASGDVQRIGEMVDRSQLGAERGLGNQVPETITLARLARELGAVAASAFGAGFGGSVWALVNTDNAEEFRSKWADQYRSRFPESAAASEFFLTCAGPPMIEFAN